MSNNSVTESVLGSDIQIGCGCAACHSGPRSPLLEAGSGDITTGNDTSYSGQPTWGREDFDNYLNRGYWEATGRSERQWSGDNPHVTYSISSEYTAHDAQGIRDAFDLWAEMANITFSEQANGSDIRIVEGDGNLTAYSSYSTYVGSGNIVSDTHASADHVISVNMYIDNGGTTPRTNGPTYGTDMSEYGDYAKTTIIHEIGHSLGFGHTGNYNGSANYANDASAANDTTQYSVMSYFSETNYGGANFLGSNASTPMLMDIYAIQQKYGANMSTRTGDSIYGFNANTGGPYDFTQHDGVPVVAIWDAGGVDTLDFSGYSNSQLINLNAGSFSNAGGGTGNIAIAYGATIENAVGGSGTDIIYGNTSNNNISGGNGTDTIYGSAGTDTLNGGEGNDTLTYSYDISDFLITLIDSVTLSMSYLNNLWVDTVSNFENFIFAGQSYTWEALQQTDSFANIENIYVRVEDGSDGFTVNSSEVGSTTVLANNLNQSNGDDSVFRVTRTATTISGGILDASVDHVTLIGTDNNDNITISTAVISAASGDIRGGEGNDIITVNNNITGQFYIQGEAGNDTITGGEGNDRLYGGTGDDIINGGNGGDLMSVVSGTNVMNGGEGNDLLLGGSEGDTLNGDAGQDNIFGGEGNDTINGGTENDRLNGDGGNDNIDGGLGNDTIKGGSGDDTITGGDGEDSIIGEAGEDNIRGGQGNDRIFGGGDNDELYGDAGIDIIQGDGGVDTIYGGEDGDLLYGGTGGDTLYGEDGDDILYGEDGNDILSGAAGRDTIHGGLNNDTITGGSENDKLYGGAGIDDIRGEDGNDFVDGGTDADFLYGDAGNDILLGGDGVDTIRGGQGDDTLYGQGGNDIIYDDLGRDNFYGGLGADDFVFQSGSAFDSYNVIRDFSIAEGDQINISDVLTGYTPGDDISDWVQVTLTSDNLSSEILVDANGGGDSFARITFVSGVNTLGTAQDMIDNNELVV